MGDLRIYNRMIEAENKAQKEAMEQAKKKRDHPGCVFDDSEDDWLDRVQRLQEL